jgi:hypothetical protein
MLKFHIEETLLGSPDPVFEDEVEPRRGLLAALLVDQAYEEDIDMFLGEIAKAAAGEPGIVVGNHAVWAIMSRDKVILEQMLYGDERTDGTEPARTEITLTEAKQLILDWREAKRHWHAEHYPAADAVTCGQPSSK